MLASGGSLMITQVDGWGRFSCACLQNVCLATVGDGNCGYRAVAIGLVVAMAGLSEHAWARFEQHLKSLWREMQQHDYLLQCQSPSRGHVKLGYDALMVRTEHTK